MAQQNIQQQIYAELGIDTHQLGCIMLDTEPIKVSDIIDPDDLYFSDDAPYVAGIVSETVPHCTLLFGLMQSGQTWKSVVDLALSGWSIDSVGIDEVSYFDGADDDNAYYCIIARLFPSSQLVEGNSRLRQLPHVDNFSTYLPHITLSYIKKDEVKRDSYIKQLNDRLMLKSVGVKGLNYGD
jgi:hypothetical protein